VGGPSKCAGGRRRQRRAAGDDRGSGLPCNQEALLEQLILEDEEDAGGDRHRFRIEGRGQEAPQLALVEILLKGVAAREIAVAVGREAADVALAHDHHGDREATTGERIGTSDGFGPLGRLLDDVEDEAEIDDVGGPERIVVGPVMGIPAHRIDAGSGQGAHIVALAAAVVEHAGGVGDQAEAVEGLHGCGQPITDDRRLVPGNNRCRADR
jgi:hypothetical protein